MFQHVQRCVHLLVYDTKHGVDDQVVAKWMRILATYTNEQLLSVKLKSKTVPFARYGACIPIIMKTRTHTETGTCSVIVIVKYVIKFVIYKLNANTSNWVVDMAHCISYRSRRRQQIANMKRARETTQQKSIRFHEMCNAITSVCIYDSILPHFFPVHFVNVEHKTHSMT